MLGIGTYVIYGTSGACQINDIVTRNFSGNDEPYYVLNPVFGTGSVFYVPAQNELATSRLKQVLTRDEIETLIDSMPNEQPVWITDNRARMERHNAIIKDGDRHDLVRMMIALHNEKLSRQSCGRKLGSADEASLSKAEGILFSEIALVLEIEPSEVSGYIRGRLGQ